MSPFSETSIIIKRELRKNFRSAKGIVLAVLSLLGGTGAALLLVKYQQFKREQLPDVSPEQMTELREKALEKLTGDADLAHYLAQAPEVLLAISSLTIWLIPLLIALMGFDAVSTDLQHRAVRYWTVRTRRGSYFTGKFFGLWATISIVTFAMQIVVWAVCIARGEASASVTLSWGFRFWLISLPIGAAWCGLALLVGSLFKTPFLALLTICASFFGLWFVHIVGAVAGAGHVTDWLYPNAYDSYMLSPRPDRVAIGAVAGLLFAALSVGAGSTIFAKRDV